MKGERMFVQYEGARGRGSGQRERGLLVVVVILGRDTR